jgi:hypothetical protein
MIDRALVGLAGMLGLVAALATMDATTQSVAGAPTYPNRAVRIIVPFRRAARPTFSPEWLASA